MAATPSPPVQWAAVVFARNEAGSIAGCIAALAAAGRGVADLDIAIILNGTGDDSAGRAAAALRAAGRPGRIWAIEEGCKANAFNQYVHRLRPAARTYFFIDGYAAVAEDALRRLAAALDAAPMAQAAAATPSTGRSAARLRAHMIREPGLHGSLFALRGTFVQRIAQAGFRLPLRMYRGDGLIGSMVLHDLDTADGGWRPERIVVEPGATWRAPDLRPWRARDLRRHWNRLVQQARGRLQWGAVRAAIYPGGYAALPADADDSALRWMAAAPGRQPAFWRDPMGALAMARMRAQPSAGRLSPELLEAVA